MTRYTAHCRFCNAAFIANRSDLVGSAKECARCPVCQEMARVEEIKDLNSAPAQIRVAREKSRGALFAS